MRVRRHCISRIALSAVLWALTGVCGVAQDMKPNRFFLAWQTADGLPDNSVTGVVQGSDGYLWVATEGGLMRFNGASFSSISMRRFPTIRSQAVRGVSYDTRGQLWVEMEYGPVIRLGRHGARTFSEKDGLFPREVTGIAEDGEGAMWLAFHGGMCRIVEDHVERFTEAEGLPAGDGTWVGRSGHGPLWFARGGQVGVYRDGNFQVVHDFKEPRLCLAPGSAGKVWVGVGSLIMSLEVGKEPEEQGRLPDSLEASVMFEDKIGALWVGTSTSGLFRLAEGEMERVPTSNPDIDCINQDREGNIWAGTNGGGLNLIRLRAMTVEGKSVGLPFESVLSVCEDMAGRIWAVGQGGGLAWKQAQQWNLVRGDTGQFTCASADAKEGVWVGTRNHGLKHFLNGKWKIWNMDHGLASNTVRSILVAKNGDVWCALDSPQGLQRLRNGEITRFDADREIGAIPAMAEAADGTIWIGTEDGWVLRVAEQSLVNEPAIAEKAPMPVRSLGASPDGSLWIGYAGDGLGWFKDGKYARITTAEGLMDDYISQLLADGNGALWIAANRGIFQVDLGELLAVATGESKWVRSRVYGRGEGLPSLQANRDHSPSACRASDGTLLFSMRNGLLVVQPEKIRDNPEPPAVLIERVSLDDSPAALYGNRTTLQREGKGHILDLSKQEEVLMVPPGHNKLKFEFAALSFASPANVHFRYRLTNFDRDWIEADTQHSATYPRLPGGNYKFQVIACNNSGVWNETGATLALVVAPFFWDTWWFKIGGGLVTVLGAGGGVFLGQRRRHRVQLAQLRAKRALEEERARIARDIHDDLGASLTRIMLMSRPANDGAEGGGSAAMPQIFETSRNLIRSMGEVVWAINPDQDTFDGLADYLSNYAQGFMGLAGIRCRLEMPLKLPERRLSAQVRHNLFLAFKEALNNVVKHSGASEVRISLIPKTKSLLLRIEDNGSGIHTEAGTGNGLGNMKKRLAEIGGTCVLRDSGIPGTRLEFEVLLKTEP